MKEFTKTPLALAIGATFTVSLATTPVNAADFGMTDLASGYMQVALAGDKGEEGKCGEKKEKDGEGKCGEGKCGEGKCGSDKDDNGEEADDAAKEKEGDASNMAGDKGEEGKCGEGKCGGDKDGDDDDDDDDDDN